MINMVKVSSWRCTTRKRVYRFCPCQFKKPIGCRAQILVLLPLCVFSWLTSCAHQEKPKTSNERERDCWDWMGLVFTHPTVWGWCFKGKSSRVRGVKSGLKLSSSSSFRTGFSQEHWGNWKKGKAADTQQQQQVPQFQTHLIPHTG